VCAVRPWGGVCGEAVGRCVRLGRGAVCAVRPWGGVCGEAVGRCVRLGRGAVCAWRRRACG